MGLRDLSVKNIDRRKVGRRLRKPVFHEDRPINAFDFETRQDGKIYLVAYVYDSLPGEKTWHPAVVGNPDFSPLTDTELFKILVTNQTRQPAVNVWFNLDFDTNALIGTVFTEDQMRELADTNTTMFTYNDIEYELTYVNGKFLSIKDENRHTSTHYDISQFFNSTLNKASKDWLGTEKDDIDPTKAADYEWKTVISYAKKDALLTQNLWKEFIRIGEKNLNIPLGKPISTGYIAQNVVYDTLIKKPNWANTQFQNLARKSYYGGRFEVYRRGFFPNVIGLDINSAYPYHMAQMPDLGGCDIELIPNPNLSDLESADWGYVTIKTNTDISRNIQPFPTFDNTVIYPALNEQFLTVTIHEFLFALKNDYLTNYDLLQAGLVYEKENVKRPFDFLRDWYIDRKKYKDQITKKNDRYDKFQYILKVIMNSVYGKTCQVTEKKRYANPSRDYSTKAYEYLTKGYTDSDIIGSYEAGGLFNPFYASYITAKTRLQLHNLALSLNVENDTIMFATDCIMIEKNNLSPSKLKQTLRKSNVLGGWDLDYEGNAFVVGSGVYDVYQNDNLYKIARRGFREVTKNYESWREAAKQSNGKIVLENERPARFKEWLLHEGHPRPAEFFLDERTLTPNFDKGRNWKENATFKKLLTTNHASTPLTTGTA